MKSSKDGPSEPDQPDIRKFLLKTANSLRNEVEFTPISEMVHPLTFSYDLRKHANMNAIPAIDKLKDTAREVKELFFKLVE